VAPFSLLLSSLLHLWNFTEKEEVAPEEVEEKPDEDDMLIIRRIFDALWRIVMRVNPKSCLHLQKSKRSTRS